MVKFAEKKSMLKNFRANVLKRRPPGSSPLSFFAILLTKMSDMTRRFDVILTSFASDKRNGQVQV